MNLKNAGELVCADARLAGHDQVHGLKHLVERHTGVLEYAADRYCELLRHSRYDIGICERAHREKKKGRAPGGARPFSLADRDD